MIQHNRQLWSRLKTHNVTVSVKPVEEEICLAYRIRASIDTGNGRQRVILSSLEEPDKAGSFAKDLAMPARIGTLECIYTRCSVPLRSNVYKLIMSHHPGSRIEMIVPEVSAPGDYLVFRKPTGKGGITVIEALRVIKDHISLDTFDERQG